MNISGDNCIEITSLRGDTKFGRKIFPLVWDLSGRFKSKETDFSMSNSIINNLTSTDKKYYSFVQNVCQGFDFTGQ